MPREIPTLCPYCGVGCGLLATAEHGRITRIRGNPKHPANLGRICPKGGTVAQTVNVPGRLRYNMSRESKRDAMQVVSAATAIRRVAGSLDQILQKHGPSAIAFYLSGQLTTESQYLFNKFAKAYLRTNHCDSNSRLCMASAAAGMKLSLGSDGPPTNYSDIEQANLFFIVGSNAADCHPVLFERVKKRMEHGAKCIVVDPRRTATADAATIHLPIRPGTDLTLLNGLLRLMKNWGKLDEAFIADHTEGWAEMVELLKDYSPDDVAERCGISRESLIDAARMISASPKQLTFWTMGVNQTLQGTFTSNAIINFHLAMGRIGKPGAGPFSLTGQPNAMGGRDVGYMSHLLPGQRNISDPQHRAEMEKIWALPPGAIRAEPGYDAVRMFESMEAGEIKAIWIVGSNPAASMPNLPMVRRALEKCELVIVQDAYTPTETTRYADVLLPAAVNVEQDGTFCNSERRVSLMQRVVSAPGEAKADWWWAREVAAAMGFYKGMQFDSAEQIFDEFARSTAGRPNDQSGLSHALLKEKGPQLWPRPAMGAGAPRRYTDGVYPTTSGRAKFWRRDDLAPQERVTSTFPLLLTTGRTLNQWHTRTKTGLVRQLNELDSAPYLQIHSADAAELTLADGDEVTITSQRGQARSHVRIDDSISPGVVFVPIHWNELWAEAASPNEATTSEADPISKQPALKCCAVRVEAVRPKVAEEVAVAASI